ncbi:hypothetical protein BGP_2046 [Beggiatoa sp. PS]|nr:hypothetical protein BGP_2046 [Beggiatoa sp. PS]
MRYQYKQGEKKLEEIDPNLCHKVIEMLEDIPQILPTILLNFLMEKSIHVLV